MTFSDLGLAEPILRAVAAEGYSTPTPIQAQAIPHVLEGRDVLGCAQTGTGKTAAFSLPLIHRLMSGPRPAVTDTARGAPKRNIRALILAPTRELALQIVESIHTYARGSGMRYTAIFGGVNQSSQTRALKDGVDIVVATPGRLMDLMQQGYVDLRRVETFILDEADRMLDMGFIQPIRTIAAAVPKNRQTLLFSATMPGSIRGLADSLLNNPALVQIASKSASPDKINQAVYHVRRAHKPQLLNHVLTREYVGRALVFTRTKHGADKLVRHLTQSGIHAEAIHGNKRQNVRQRTLSNFRDGRTTVLVATDIAARGIDVDDVTHVVNFDIPYEAETYVHRIGRTGRAGSAGLALSFCDTDERSDLKSIERLIRRPIEVRTDHPEYTAPVFVPPAEGRAYAPRGGGGDRAPRHEYPSRGGHPRAQGGKARPPRRAAEQGAGSGAARPQSHSNSADRAPAGPNNARPARGPRPMGPLARHKTNRSRPHSA